MLTLNTTDRTTSRAHTHDAICPDEDEANVDPPITSSLVRMLRAWVHPYTRCLLSW
jgi:hypothetical protein